MPPVGFEPTISAGERPQIYALDRAATGTGSSGKWMSSLRNFLTMGQSLVRQISGPETVGGVVV